MKERREASRPDRHRPVVSWLTGLGISFLPLILGWLRPQEQEREPATLEASVAAGHERRDLSLRGVGLFLVGLVIMTGVAIVITTVLQIASSRIGGITFPYPPLNLANAPQPALPPEPRLEDLPGKALQDLHTQEDELLHTTGWVDQNTGVIHIPIERAIDLLLQRGLPTRDQGNVEFHDSGDQNPSDSSSGRMMEGFP